MHDSATSSQNRTNLQATLGAPVEIIRAEIKAHGPISFARFMELALYCPDCGFYERESDTVGRHGDFYTSVSVGSLFGQLLAFQFSVWLDELEDPSRGLKIVEAGAHDGQLAKDILHWLRAYKPDVLEAVEFWIIEPSRRRQLNQQQVLHDFGPNVRWAEKVTDVGAVTGIIYSNELLDAMPVRRFGWDAGQQEWLEWGVAMDQEQFVWQRITQTDGIRGLLASAGFQFQPQLLAVLPDGFTIEVSPDAQAWWRGAANALQYGKLLTFDYGLSASQFISPERREGTLRAYHRHRLINDVLANPGEQDITAHVNFTAIQTVGEAAGLRTETFQTQTKFLTAIASQILETKSDFGHWTAEQTRQFQTLTHPDHLGRSFRVLVQSR